MNDPHMFIVDVFYTKPLVHSANQIDGLNIFWPYFKETKWVHDATSDITVGTFALCAVGLLPLSGHLFLGGAVLQQAELTQSRLQLLSAAFNLVV